MQEHLPAPTETENLVLGLQPHQGKLLSFPLPKGLRVFLSGWKTLANQQIKEHSVHSSGALSLQLGLRGIEVQLLPRSPRLNAPCRMPLIFGPPSPFSDMEWCPSVAPPWGSAPCLPQGTRPRQLEGANPKSLTSIA